MKERQAPKIDHAHDIVLFSGDGEWSALYVDGDLVSVGDHYLQDEKLREMFGVQEIQTDDFLQGGDRYEDVAQTLIEVKAYQDARIAREHKAAMLRRQAAELLAQAEELS